MELFLLIILILLAVGGVAAFFILHRHLQQLRPTDNSQSFGMFQEQLKEIRQAMNLQQGEMNKQLQVQFGQSSGLIRDVTERLTKLDETNRQVVGFASQMQSLENILKSPKQRGILGEYFLETVLKSTLPPASYKLQYQFTDGEIVDAIITTKDGLIPIDSKFSLENYNKIVEEDDPARRTELEKVFKADLKKRIDETSKYIRPKEGTMDFAFMFIPAEGIYYDLLINQVGAIKVNTRDLIEYAFKEKHVIIVSPTTFFAYLQTVLQGFRAFQFEEQTKEIRARVEQLQRHIIAYDDYMKKLGNNLGTTVNAYNTASKELSKVDKDVIKITGQTSGLEPLTIDKPRVDND